MEPNPNKVVTQQVFTPTVPKVGVNGKVCVHEVGTDQVLDAQLDAYSTEMSRPVFNGLLRHGLAAELRIQKLGHC